MSRRIPLAIGAGSLLAATVALTGPTVSAAVTPDTSAFLDAVTVDGIREHQAALQAIADANGGHREASSPGYEASVDYVADTLEPLGYEVTVQPFEYELFYDEAVPTLVRTDVDPDVSYVDANSAFPDGDFATMTYTVDGSGTDLPVTPVDLSLADPALSTSGCEAADFAGFPAGDVALVQRGACSFAQKTVNASDAGAAAVIVFNQGDGGADRTDVFFGTLGAPLPGVDITSFSASFDVGVALSEPGATVSYSADTALELRESANVLAETPGGRDDRVVVAGGHLDSVPEGPGINDNGSGVAVLLEIAEELAERGTDPRNKVRFAFWGAEESGLLGAEHYVAQLSKRERKSIALNLNFDMLGSPNYVRFVYDGDGSAFGAAGPNGSGTIEQVFLDHFAAQGLQTEPTAFDGRSDYGPFIAAGIPAGGLFSGAEGIKTPEEAAIYGGVAGEAYDPCYHAACDTFDNVSLDALDELGDAAAHAVLVFAETTSAVNGTGKASSTATAMSNKGPRATA